MSDKQGDQWNIKRAGILQKRGTHKNERCHSRLDLSPPAKPRDPARASRFDISSSCYDVSLHDLLYLSADMYFFGLLGLVIP
jgi:hypothetical protein